MTTTRLSDVPILTVVIAGGAGLLAFDIIVFSGQGTLLAPALIAMVLGAALAPILKNWTIVLAGLVLVVVFIPSNGRVVVAGWLPFKLEPYRLVVALLLAGWVAGLLVDPRVRARKTRFEGPLILIAVATVGSLLANPGRVSAQSAHVIKVIWLLASFFLVMYLIVSVVRTRTAVDQLIKVLVWGGCVVAFVAVVQRRTGTNLIDAYVPRVLPMFDYFSLDTVMRGGLVRASASAAHPIELSTSMSMLAALATYLAISRRQLRWWVAVAALVLGALAAGSRTGIVGIVVVMVVFIWLRPRQTLRYWPVVFLILPLVYFAAPGTLGGIKAMFFPTGGIVAEQARTHHGKALNRVSRIGPALAEFRQHDPLVGEGFGTRIVGTSHDNAPILDNQWLRTLLETGLLGALGWVWLFVRVTRRLSRRAKLERESAEGWLSVALAAAVASFATSMLLYDAFSFIQSTFIAYMLVAFAAVLLWIPPSRSSPRDGVA